MKILKVMFSVTALLAFFLLGFATSCSMLPTEVTLEPYISSFEKDMGFEKDKFKDYDMSFRTIKGEDDGYIILGQCNTGTGRITINPSFWYNWGSSQMRKKGLVYHEMAHCVCRLPHTNDLFKDDCAKSLMHENLPKNYCLKRHWRHYMKDLKTRCGE